MEMKTLQSIFGGNKNQCRRLRRLMTGYREDILRTTENSRFSEYTHPELELVCNERWDSILNLIMQMGNVPIVQDPEGLDDGLLQEDLPFEVMYFCDTLTRLTWTLRWEFRNKEGRKVQIQHWSELHHDPMGLEAGDNPFDPETAGFYVGLSEEEMPDDECYDAYGRPYVNDDWHRLSWLSRGCTSKLKCKASAEYTAGYYSLSYAPSRFSWWVQTVENHYKYIHDVPF